MNIYKIHVEHFSQKDSHKSTEAYLVADSDEAVYNWVDKKECGTYTDRNDEDGLIDIYDDEYNVIGQESFKEKMLRVGGEFFDEDYEPEELYYGATIYGWEKLETNPFDLDIGALLSIGILEDALDSAKANL